jgi:apolipoprotein D and lipocalin family protein
MKIPEALVGGGTFFLSRGESIEPVKIDLSKYMGTWRVIACTDNELENQFADATETYELIGVKHVDVVFKWREGSLTGPVRAYDFRGKILSHPSHGIWKMNLFPLFCVTYIVVEVAPDYSWAAVAHPSKKFGWLLARKPKLPEETVAHFYRVFATLGYDTTKFIKVPQP